MKVKQSETDFRQEINVIFADLLANQIPPDPVLDAVWNAGIPALYQE
jgi:hypothetical protein